METLTIPFTIGKPRNGTLTTTNLAKAGRGGSRARFGGRELQTLKGIDLLTPRGGFFDGRNQNRDPEPSAKPLRHSDKPTNLEMLFLRTGSTAM